jgi:uncharacterized protein
MSLMSRYLLTLAFVGVAAAAPPVAPQVSPFPLKDVRLLDGPFLDVVNRDVKYLLSLDPDRLLHTFRVNAGLPTSAKPLGGWEKPDCELRGHSLGHYLTACSLMYAATGDERLKQRAAEIVKGLAEVQAALPSQGYKAGYLSAFPESFLDRWDDTGKVWAPWYTLHKIMAGLIDDYEICGNQQALDVAVRMAGWVTYRMDRRTPEQIQKSLNNEIGGIGESLANLYAITGNPNQLRTAQAFDHNIIFDPLSQGVDPFDGKHANTQIPKLIAAARLYELTGDPKYRRIAEYGWRRVALDRSFVHGGHSDDEHFFPVTDFAKHLGPDTAETCNTYNMLKLTRHLFAWQPSADLTEFNERALFNHILTAQDPKTGMFVYFATLKPGHFKTYSTPENSFWCCVGTGMENPARFGESIYFHGADSLYVNLFIASQLTWADKGVVVRQETRFPDEDTVHLTIKAAHPVELALNLRHPRWSAGMTVALNGKTVDAGSPGSYAVVKRTWKDGDRIDIRVPMTLRTEPLPGTRNTVAFLYGPIVLAGELGRQGMETIDEYAVDQSNYSKLPPPAVPVLVSSNSGKLTAQVIPVEGQPLTFQTKGLGRPKDISLIPLFRTNHQRYSVYWDIVPPAAK